MKWLFRRCGCGAQAIEDMSVDELCNKAVDLEVERDTKLEEISKLEEDIERELVEDDEQLSILEVVVEKYETKKVELENKECIFSEIESEYIKSRNELENVRNEFNVVEREFKASNKELERELRETKELKENREDAKSRILGIDVESSKLREVIDGQIVDLSLKIEKLEGI